MPAYLPTELISLIFKFAPIVAPSKQIIEEANATFELSQAFSDSGYESFSQWFFGKTPLLDRCRDKSKRFNCLEYRCEIGEGEPCVRCRFPRTYIDLQEEGYDGMCSDCYECVYHDDQDPSPKSQLEGYEYDPRWEDEEDDEY